MRIVFLTLTTFSTKGGVEKVCSVFCKVLSDLKQKLIIKPVVLSAYDRTEQCETKYCDKSIFHGFNKSRLKFLLASSIKSMGADRIILSHINLLPVARLVKAFSPKSKIILIAHGIEVWRDLVPWKQNFLQVKCDEIWAVSHYTAKILIEKHKIADSKIKVVNNCLDPYLEVPLKFEKPDYLLKRYNISKEQKIVFTLTRLAPTELFKGYDLVIKNVPALVEKYPDLKYFIAGKPHPDEAARLENLIKEYNVTGNVKLLGYLPDNELNDHFLLADVFVMPSKKEGFGIVFIEAAACGCRVIGGNADGSVDALLNGRLGTLVDPDSQEEIREAIDENLKTQQSTNAASAQRELCLQHFSYKNYLQQIQNLLKSA